MGGVPGWTSRLERLASWVFLALETWVKAVCCCKELPVNTAVAGIAGDFGGTFGFLPRGQLNSCRHRHHEETRTDYH